MQTRANLTKLCLAFWAFVWTSGCSTSDETAHACTPPLASWGKPHLHIGPGGLMFRVSLDHDGVLYMSGKRSDLKSFEIEMAKVRRVGPPEPAVILETEMGAPCETLDTVRAIMDRQLACTHGGHCDEGVQAIWDKLPYAGAGIP